MMEPRVAEEDPAPTESADGAACRLRDKAEGALMIRVVLVFYFVDATLLLLYALLGLTSLRYALAYAVVGLLTSCALRLFARYLGSAATASDLSVTLQACIALSLTLGTAWLNPQIGLPLVLAAVSVVATSALRLRSSTLLGIIIVVTLLTVGLFNRKEALPALPMSGLADSAVSSLFVCWTLLKTATVNVIGSRFRRDLDDSNLALSHALSEVERLANIDELTALPNRRAILRSLACAQQHQAQTGQALGLALLDIDHFKQVNDRFGHAAGDEVLREVGLALQRGLRAGDQVGRYGGEEFLLLLHGVTDAADLQALCERTRHGVEAHDWARLGQGLQITVSMGATLACPAEAQASSLARADQALYRAKDGGRNQVVLALAASA